MPSFRWWDVESGGECCEFHEVHGEIRFVKWVQGLCNSLRVVTSGTRNPHPPLHLFRRFIVKLFLKSKPQIRGEFYLVFL